MKELTELAELFPNWSVVSYAHVAYNDEDEKKPVYNRPILIQVILGLSERVKP